VICPDAFSPPPSTSTIHEEPENEEEHSDYPEPTDEGNI
jgi:hypothetical protein